MKLFCSIATKLFCSQLRSGLHIPLLSKTAQQSLLPVPVHLISPLLQFESQPIDNENNNDHYNNYTLC